MLAVLSGCVGFFLQPAETQNELRQLVTSTWQPGARVAWKDVLADLWDAYLEKDAPLDLGPTEPRTLVIGGMPRATTFPHGSLKTWINRAYAVGYSEELGVPAWVVYRVGGGSRLLRAPERPERFVADRRAFNAVRPEDYTRTGFDRGHLAPNFAIGLWFGQEAQEETFLMTNVAPQTRSLNAGPWRELESRIALSYPARLEEIWVTCGPIFESSPQTLSGGRVAIPQAFFLIVVDRSAQRLRSMAFAVPQTFDDKAGLESFLMSIDAIESQVGLDFFRDLPDALERELEASRSHRVW